MTDIIGQEVRELIGAIHERSITMPETDDDVMRLREILMKDALRIMVSAEKLIGVLARCERWGTRRTPVRSA